MNKAITYHNSIADDYASRSGTQASMVRQLKRIHIKSKKKMD